MEPSVTVQGLVKRYSDKYALDGIDLAIMPGRISGILGPNGSGKTTLLRIIAGLLDRNAGTVQVCGRDPAEERDFVKHRVGYVPETPAMYESLSPREFFTFVSSARGIDPHDSESRVGNLAGAFGLDEHMDSFIGSLSFGTKQKVAIIASLLHDPDIIIMDEGMNGLDPRSARILKELLREFASLGKTIIFSTHVMDVAESVCDTVSILYDGGIAGTGTLEELRGKSGGRGGNLEEIFLQLTGNEDLDPLLRTIKESFRK